MKKLGFIDLFIDEWHANNYPAWIKTARRGTEFELAYAWEKAPQNGRPLEKWCADFGVTPLKSMEEVVEKSDAVFVLAPSNPEVHRELAEIPLKSGKPVFMDKPFAPSKADAEAMFELAAKHNTPLMSSSALRFSTELDAYRNKPGTTYMETTGGGRSFWEYSIHQIEMIVSVLGTGAKRIMQCGANDVEHMVIQYEDDRRASVTYTPNAPFTTRLVHEGKMIVNPQCSDFFPILLSEILDFFATGKSPIDTAQTIEIAALVAAGIKALEAKNVWHDL
ncbi:MAG: Gfo/Idh/MocA family oxidoreductase [Lentisphaeria bacterium]|nr:Gfo/Idh/MocA family oxidoreductase [Lentisphaeria bacterium]